MQPLKVGAFHNSQLRRRPCRHRGFAAQRAGQPRSDGEPHVLTAHDGDQPIEPPVGAALRRVEPGLKNRLTIEVATRTVRNSHRVQRQHLVAIPELKQRLQSWRQRIAVGQLNKI